MIFRYYAACGKLTFKDGKFYLATNSVNGILTIITLSKNSIHVLCESREQPNLDQVLYFAIQLHSIIRS